MESWERGTLKSRASKFRPSGGGGISGERSIGEGEQWGQRFSPRKERRDRKMMMYYRYFDWLVECIFKCLSQRVTCFVTPSKPISCTTKQRLDDFLPTLSVCRTPQCQKTMHRSTSLPKTVFTWWTTAQSMVPFWTGQSCNLTKNIRSSTKTPFSLGNVSVLTPRSSSV